MEYVDHIQRLAIQEPCLARELACLTSVDHVLAWASSTGRSLRGLDVIAQDEYSHDFIMYLEEDRYLSFGMT